VFISVVDDEADLAYLFRDALNQIPDVRVFAFSDPNLAFEHFLNNQNKYICMISDYRMPELDGLQLLSKVKKINRGVTSILISAFEAEDNLFKDCDCIDKFLQKPITMGDLVHEVKKYINKVEVQKLEE
jgi:DNA-binding NtrC family response regulator